MPETTVEVPATQDSSRDEEPVIHTAHELELQAEVDRLRTENDQLRATNQELFIRAGGESPQTAIDPVASTDERLLNIVRGGFSARAIREA